MPELRELSIEFASYADEFQSLYEGALVATFGTGLEYFEASHMYLPEELAAASLSGYETRITPREAVGLLVVLEASAYRAKHGALSGLLRKEVGKRMNQHRKMLALVASQIPNLKGHPVMDQFAERMRQNLK